MVLSKYFKGGRNMNKRITGLLSLVTIGLLSGCGQPSSSSSSLASSSSSQYISKDSKTIASEILAQYKNGKVTLPDSQNYGLDVTEKSTFDATGLFNQSGANIKGSEEEGVKAAFMYDGQSSEHSAGIKVTTSTIAQITDNVSSSESSNINNVGTYQAEVSDKTYERKITTSKDDMAYASVSADQYYSALLANFNSLFGSSITTLSQATIPSAIIPDAVTKEIENTMDGDSLLSTYFNFTAIQREGCYIINSKLKSNAATLTNAVDYATLINSYISTAKKNLGRTKLDLTYGDLHLMDLLNGVNFKSFKITLPTSTVISSTFALDASTYLPVSYVTKINLNGVEIKGSYTMTDSTAEDSSSSSAAVSEYSFGFKIKTFEESSQTVISYGQNVTAVKFSDEDKKTILAKGTDNTEDFKKSLGIAE
jgi:hypothetical protein